MRLLLDSHALIWWLADNPRLSAPARSAVADSSNEVFVSPASAWEIATKLRLGRLIEPGAGELVEGFDGITQSEGFAHLVITNALASAAGRLSGPHRDPFDRMLIAQCRALELAIVSIDRCFDDYAVARVW
jgi:PIN domain nuclease of toxin-antitoxin system